ncbi:unnamed protein product [Aureobasidium mustum]|uniref:Uncharacterized protein n=1 Tax=Aureobasidium mustum TaxID=2773714 RepID=A0A9N8K0E1_9PEZI|nr:unnamed protein product [Aureobasidium mustum]
MQFTKSEPYIAAVLGGAQTELDLSGDQPFNLSITLTLHAKAPIICYIGEDDTFFVPRNALYDAGIIFKDDQTKQQIPSCHIDICRLTEFSGPERPLNEHTRLYMQPEKPVVFDIRFNSTQKMGGDGNFDSKLCMATSGFRTGCTYHASLPNDRKISWWRWASFWEAEGQGQEDLVVMAGIRSGTRSVVGWWTGDKERRRGVPVLSEDNKLPIYIEGDGVVFSCVGEPMKWPVWPLPDDDYQRRMAEEGRERMAKREKAYTDAMNAARARQAA